MEKSQFKDGQGRYLTQSLFLEDSYNMERAVFTYDGEDKLYKGETFISLKSLYLDAADPEEYMFATTNLYDWPHWKKMCKNKVILSHIQNWREELVLSLRSEGIGTMVDLAINKGSYQAAKYLADRGWIDKVRGRPSEDDIKKELKDQLRIKEEYSADMSLLTKHRGIK